MTNEALKWKVSLREIYKACLPIYFPFSFHRTLHSSPGHIITPPHIPPSIAFDRLIAPSPFSPLSSVTSDPPQHDGGYCGSSEGPYHLPPSHHADASLRQAKRSTSS